MTKQKLEGLVEEDPLENSRAKMISVHRSLELKYAQLLIMLPTITPLFSGYLNSEIFVDLLKNTSQEKLEHVAYQLHVEVDPLAEYIELHKRYNKEFLNRVGVEEQKE